MPEAEKISARSAAGFRWLVPLLCAFGLGCSPASDPQILLADYRQALAEALGVESEVARVRTHRYPDRVARTAPAEPVNVSLREFWGLKRCDVRAQIAGRNTPLGKAASGFMHLAYEHELLVSLTDCVAVAATEGETESAIVLARTVLEAKQASRDATFWNATFGSREFAALFASAAPPFVVGDPGVDAPDDAVADLRLAEARFGQAGQQIDQDQLAAAFQVLEQSRYGGRLLKSLAVAAAELDAANRLLEGADLTQLCPMAATRRARELERAFRWYYVREIQPWLAELDRHGGPWLRSLNALLDAQAKAMPSGFRAFALQHLDPEAPDGTWSRYRRAILDHAAAWSALFERCGIPLSG